MKDSIKVELKVGKTYTITGFGPLRIKHPEGHVVALVDDTCQGQYTTTYTPAATAFYEIEGWYPRVWITENGATYSVPETEPPKPKTYITLDTETSGLNIESNGIIQIGAWATGENEDDFKGYFLSDCNPAYPSIEGNARAISISEEALKVNGFTISRIDQAPRLGLVLRNFNEWMTKWTDDTNVIIVGQNTAFDIAWLKRDFRRAGLDDKIFRRFADLYTLSFLKYGEPMGLARLAEKEGIRNRDAHDALTDAYTTAKLFHRLVKELAKF